MALQSSFLSTPRLPTPPRDAEDETTRTVDDAIRYLDASLSSSPLAVHKLGHGSTGQSSLDTPPSSSPLHQPLKNRDAPPAKAPKRLRFSAETSFCEAEIKPLPPSKEQNSTKSILKPFEPLPASSTADVTTTFPDPDSFSDFAGMLESVVKELAGNDQASRHDAYMTLSRSIKAYQNLPDTDALLGKLSLLEQFMKRDIAQTEIVTPTKALRIQALQLASTLIWRLPPWKDSSSPPGVSIDFVSFLIIQAINVLEDHTIAKEFMRHHLVILTMQEVYTKAMTAERAAKVIKLLSSVHERVTGNSIVQLRLMICRQITQYHPSAVIEEVSSIIPYILHGLCSSDKETRSRAVETGLVLGTCIGHRRRVAHAIRDTLKKKSSQDATYTDHFEKRLRDLMRNVDDNHHVPQIWGLLILMLRGDTIILREWLARKSWLKIIEHCFNSSDVGLNLHSWTAWNRTIYSAHRLMIQHDSVLKRLCQPVFGHLQRKSNSEFTLPVKKSAYSSYYLILYYCFGQKLEPNKLVSCWELVVGEMCQRLSSKHTGDGHRFALALRALLSDSLLKVWNAERGLLTVKSPMLWDEVPRLDCMWVRRYTGLIIKTLQPLLIQAPYGANGPGFANIVWTSMMKAIAQAGEKEIKSSNEFRGAFADLLNYLNRVWMANKNVRNSLDSSDPSQITSFLGLIQSSIEHLGAMHWGETILVRAQNGVFEATSTPSKKAQYSLGHRQTCSPIASILGLLSTHPPDTMLCPSLRIEVSSILSSCLEARPSQWSKINLIGECAGYLQSPNVSGQRSFVAHLWQTLVVLANAIIKQDFTLTDNNGVQQNDFQELLHTLQFGLHFADFKSLEIGRSLFEGMSFLARQQGGDIGALNAVASPWLEILTKADDEYNGSAVLVYLSYLLTGDFPTTVAKPIGHTQISSSKFDKTPLSAPDGWLESLASALGHGLSYSYARLEVLDSSAVNTFLSSSRAFFERVRVGQTLNFSVCESLVWKTQAGFLPWIEDVESKVIKSQSRGYDIERSFGKLWQVLLDFVARLSLVDDRPIKAVEDLLEVGFRSHNKMFANLTIEGWNRIFQDRELSGCPERLAGILARLSTYTDVQMPSRDLQSHKDGHINHLPPEDTELFPWLKDDSSQSIFDIPSPTAKIHRKPPTPFRAPLVTISSPASRNSTPTKAVNRQTPPPRLRHNDSQIQFVAVDSSPIHHLTEQDSQLMTDHQREVRSRQLADVAIFSDLRSSPIPTNAHKSDQIIEPTESKEPDEDDRKEHHAAPDMSPQSEKIESRQERAGEQPDNSTADVDAVLGIADHLLDDDATNEEPFVDAASVLDNDNDQDPSKFEILAPDSPNDLMSTHPIHSPLQDRSLNACNIMRSQGPETNKPNENSEETVERVEESFVVPSTVVPLEKQVRETSSGAFTTPSSKIIETPVQESQSAALSVVIEAPSSVPSESSRLVRRKRKAPITPESGQANKKIRPSSIEAETQKTKDSDAADGDVIVLEAPDENSPPLMTVLENLGITIPDAESPSSQTSTRKRGRPPKSSQEISVDVKEETDGIEGTGVTTKKRRRSRTIQLQPEDSHALNNSHYGRGSAQNQDNEPRRSAASVAASLKAVIGQVKEMEFDVESSERSTLLELAAELQREIVAAAGEP